MRTLFTSHVHTLTKKKKFELFCFGDVHRDTESCDTARWHDFLKYTKSFNQDDCLYMLMGDPLDFCSESELKAIRKSEFHETTMDKLEKMATKDIKLFCHEIQHMKGHMIGVVQGNHRWQFDNGITSDEVIANTMGTKYLGWLTYVSIKLNQVRGNNERGLSTAFDIVACHGKAGGKLIGTSINQVDDLRRIFPVANCYVMGHDHKLSATPATVLKAVTLNNVIHIKQLEQKLCRSGSFKKTYTTGTNGYEIGRLYQPSVLGALHMTVEIDRNTKDGNDSLTIKQTAHI